MELPLHHRFTLADEIDLVAMLGMAKIEILQSHHFPIDPSLNIVGKRFTQNDNDIYVRASNHFTGG